MDSVQRIASMDLLRGLAILGILFMNIVAFAAPEPAYISPAWAGEPSMSDKVAYSIQYLFANSRFYSLFCLLFGAGMVMFWQRAQDKGFDGQSLLMTRLRWLLLFGVLHITLLFFGDILLTYALCGFILFTKVTWDADKLIKRGLIYLSISTVLWLLIAGIFLIELPDNEQMMPIPLAAEDVTILVDQAIGTVGQMLWYNGKLGGAMILGFPILFWLLGGIMLLGMGLMKRDFFNHGLSNSHEFLLFSIGLALSVGQLAVQWQTQFLNGFSLFMPANAIAAILLALAVASRGVKVCLTNPQFSMPLQYAGRMAFSLYIFQSITMTLLFRWLAPQLFGALSRSEMLGVAVVMTIIQLILATWWQTRIGQGPLEKLWRGLIYRNHQPINRAGKDLSAASIDENQS